MSGFLTKTPQDIRKRCFHIIDKSWKSRKSRTISTFFEDFFLAILVASVLSIKRCQGRKKGWKCLAFPAFSTNSSLKHCFFISCGFCFLISCGVFVRKPDNFCSCVASLLKCRFTPVCPQSRLGEGLFSVVPRQPCKLSTDSSGNTSVCTGYTTLRLVRIRSQCTLNL